MKRTLVLATLAGSLTAALAQQPNPFARPGPPAIPPPVTASPAAVVPPPPEEPKPIVLTEEIPSVRLGRVGGEYLYRGTVAQTYVFTEAEPAINRVAMTPALEAARAEEAAREAAKKPNLPSVVGGPTPPSASAPATKAAPAARAASQPRARSNGTAAPANSATNAARK